MARAFVAVVLLFFVAGCGSSDTKNAAGAAGWKGEPGSVWLTGSYDDSVVRVDAANGKLAQMIDISSVGTEPTSIVVGGGSVWFTLNGHDQLSRITPSGAVEATTTDGAYDVAFGEGSVWATAGGIFTVRVDADTGAEIATIETKSGIIEDPIAVGGGAAWVAAGSSIDRMDAATNQVTASIPLAADFPNIQLVLSTLVYADDALWVLAYYGAPGKRALVKIDPSSNAIAAKQDLDTDWADDSLAVGLGSVWVSSGGEKIFKISPSTLQVEQEFAFDGKPGRMTVGNEYLYVTDFGNQKLWRVDPATGDGSSVDIPASSGLTFGPAQ